MRETVQSYHELAQWAYRGEVFGTTLLRSLIGYDNFPDQRAHLQLLFELEDVTGRRLETLVDVDPLSTECAATRERAIGYAKIITSSTWSEFMSETKAIAEQALPHFRRLRGLGDKSAQPVLDSVVEHELAQLRFAELTLGGDQDGAGAVVTRFLERSEKFVASARRRQDLPQLGE